MSFGSAHKQQVGGGGGATDGAWVLVVYSLNSLSWMVKYGRKSLQQRRGETQLQREEGGGGGSGHVT